MGSKYFRKLIEQQIDVFVSTFSQGSNRLFKNENNKLITKTKLARKKMMIDKKNDLCYD